MVVFTVTFEEIDHRSSNLRSQITLGKLGGKYNGALEKATVPLSIIGMRLAPHGSSEQNCWLYLKVI